MDVPSILQVEEQVTIDKLPDLVTKAFAAKYPDSKPTRAEKQTQTGKGVFFEIAFDVANGKKEATFAENGTFVEEE